MTFTCFWDFAFQTGSCQSLRGVTHRAWDDSGYLVCQDPNTLEYIGDRTIWKIKHTYTLFKFIFRNPIGFWEESREACHPCHLLNTTLCGEFLSFKADNMKYRHYWFMRDLSICFIASRTCLTWNTILSREREYLITGNSIIRFSSYIPFHEKLSWLGTWCFSLTCGNFFSMN